MDLGRELVKELELDLCVDTLGKWMAHYIAELVKGAESADDSDRQDKLTVCSDAILKIWEHRLVLPTGKRPFEDWEPILRTLESLDPDNITHRYYRSIQKTIDEPEQTVETKKWLDLADGLDYSAKILINYCIVQAAQTALDKSKRWVKLAEQAELGNGIDLSVIRVIINECDLMNEMEPNDPERKQLRDRIERLEVFLKLASAFMTDMRQQLKKTDAPN